MTNEMINRINERIEELGWDYDYIGIRTQEEEFELGAMDHVSHIWDDGEDTGEELSGVCAVNVKAFNWEQLVDSYLGEHIAIIAGNSAEYGADAGEIIIEDAEVVEILA